MPIARAVPPRQVGGWMNMENFITGYPANESAMREPWPGGPGGGPGRDVLRPAAHRFFGADDAALLAGLGANCLRIPINYRHLESDDRPSRSSSRASTSWTAWSACAPRTASAASSTCTPCPAPEPALALRQRHPCRRVLAASALPGRVVHLWELWPTGTATTPGWPDTTWSTSRATGRAGRRAVPRPPGRGVRAVDPDHVLFVDGNTYSTDFSIFGEPYENAVYALPRLRAGRVVVRRPLSRLHGRRLGRPRRARGDLPRAHAFQRETGTPIWVGEFGPVYTGDPERDEQRYQVLCDQLDIFDRHGAGWSIWTYKDVGLHGLVECRRTAVHGAVRRPDRQEATAGRRRLGLDAGGAAEVIEPLHG